MDSQDWVVILHTNWRRLTSDQRFEIAMKVYKYSWGIIGGTKKFEELSAVDRLAVVEYLVKHPNDWPLPIHEC